MSDIYISKIHGAKLKDEELTQKVSEGLVEHENKLKLLSESIPYGWQYTDGMSTLLHYDWDNECFGLPVGWDTNIGDSYINCALDTDVGGLFLLDANSYQYEDIEGGGRRWYFRVPFADTVYDGYYVYALESGSEWVKSAGYKSVLYYWDWEGKEDASERVTLVELPFYVATKGMEERGYSDTYYTDATSGVKLQTAPDVYSFDSIEDAFHFHFKVYGLNGDIYKSGIETVSELVASLKELGLTEYTQTITSLDGVQFYLDISADNPLVLKQFTRVVYGGANWECGHGNSLDCDCIPAPVYGKATAVQKVCRHFTVQGK